MLKLYGVPNSQPVRAVAWLCLMHKLPFEFIVTSQNKDAKAPAFLEHVNPRGTVPAMDDDGVILWESHAIMIYLCEKHGWHDLWPDDLVGRARINQYLHFHHRNTRELVVPWSRRLWQSVFEVEDPSPGWIARNTFPGLTNNSQICTQTIDIVETMLSETGYIAGTPGPTIADLSAYEELGQNQPRYANCLSYDHTPQLRRWLEAMATLPSHDVAHAIWQALGDINQLSGGMKTVARANKAAAALWRDTVAQYA